MIYQPIEIICTPIEKGILLGKFEWPEDHRALIGFIWCKSYKILVISLFFNTWSIILGEPDDEEGI